MNSEDRADDSAPADANTADAASAGAATQSSSTEPVHNVDEQRLEQGQPQDRPTEQSDLQKTNQFLLNILSEWQGSMKNMEAKMQKLEKEKEE